MKITDHIQHRDQTLFSFEVLPPSPGKNVEHLLSKIAVLLDCAPAFVDIPYHREQLAGPEVGAQFAHIPLQKRAGMVAMCAAVLHRFRIDPVAHILCGGFTKEETENALLDLAFLGIDNLLLLRGDSPNKASEKDRNIFTYQLVEQVQHMNQGKFLHQEWQYAKPTDFCKGVGGYPEKHHEAPDKETGIKYLKQKVNAGADYIITQMFYDNSHFFEFEKHCRNAGIQVPIIPGLRPLTSQKLLQQLPAFFNVNLPSDLEKEVKKCRQKAQVEQVGVEWAIAQSKELIKHGVPCLHYFAMNKPELIKRIVKAVF